METDTIWVATTAIATCLLAIATLVLAAATIKLAIGVPRSLRMAREDAQHRFYAELDRIYMEIQKLIIQMPYLSNPKSIPETHQTEYDAFAFITWNFIETVYDYSRSDPSILETWNPVIRYESSLHRGWFNDCKNHKKFKDRFVKYILEEVIK